MIFWKNIPWIETHKKSKFIKKSTAELTNARNRIEKETSVDNWIQACEYN